MIIQNDAAKTLNNILIKLKVPTFIPYIYNYYHNGCALPIENYSCALTMDRLPYFNKNMLCIYQLASELKAEKLNEYDDGFMIKTDSGNPRGMFIDGPNLVNLSSKYNIDHKYICYSWGFAFASLLFICKINNHDLEYILSLKNPNEIPSMNNILLGVIDFGLTSKIDKISNEILDKLYYEFWELDIILPSKRETELFPYFIQGILCFGEKYTEYESLCNHLIELFNNK